MTNPDVKAKMIEHLGETKEQIERLDECLDTCGESSSVLKDTAQSAMANSMAMAHAMAGDEILKNTFASNACENFEVAAYKSLLALCDLAGHSGCRPMLEQTLAEEERMANWVASNGEKVTGQYLAKQQSA
jgi:ferritin-like metal-binding protein YciE